MYTFFYIILIIIIIFIAIKYPHNKICTTEHFIQNRIELTQMTIDPIRFKTNNRDMQQMYFYNILKLLLPIKNDDKNFEIFIDNSFNTLPQFIKTRNSNLRLVAPLYDEYLTIMCDFSNNILTYENMLSNCIQKRDFYIVENETTFIGMEQFIQILFPTNQFTFYKLDKFPKKMRKNAYYCTFSTETDAELQQFAKINRYFIIEFPKSHPNYANLNIQNYVLSKYDISFQHCANNKKVIYSFRNSVCLYTFSFVSNFKVYNLIKALFEGLEYFKKYVYDKNVKYLFESIRPEKMIIISIIPLHTAVEKYYRELFIFTSNSYPICINNTVSALECQPQKIFDNRFKLLNLYGTS